MVASSSGGGAIGSSFTAEDADITGVEEDYAAMEEYNGEVLFIPPEIKSHCKNAEKINEKTIGIEKKDILNSLEAVDYFGGNSNLNQINLLQYKDVELRLSPKILGILRDYQKIGVKWLLSLHANGFGGCLADDMGLGKTLEIIAYLSDRSQAELQDLIIVPKTLLENWKREFRKFLPEMSIYVYHGTGRSILEAKKSRIIITTYGTLLNDIDDLCEICYP